MDTGAGGNDPCHKSFSHAPPPPCFLVTLSLLYVYAIVLSLGLIMSAKRTDMDLCLLERRHLTNTCVK
jgi:hypothetical protein